jgi:hypothetical protein
MRDFKVIHGEKGVYLLKRLNERFTIEVKDSPQGCDFNTYKDGTLYQKRTCPNSADALGSAAAYEFGFREAERELAQERERGGV